MRLVFYLFVLVLQAWGQVYFNSDSDFLHPTLSHFHNDYEVDMPVGQANPPPDPPPELPSMVHIALGSNHTNVAVSWVHNLGPPHLWAIRGSFVKYGLTKGAYNWTASARLHTYFEHAGLFADAVLYNLKPSTTYYYSVGNDWGWTLEKSFTTPPAPTKGTRGKIVMAVFGDMGIENSDSTVKQLEQMIDYGELDLVFHMGDIAYADNRGPAMYEKNVGCILWQS
eukprot:TRINITY_DN10094_c0_g1_i1.p1 TRINITY_DN10094_c0_g1~~TRINITY_DN10094_c0_g1_i1.p1  ORF type:complete len:225 (+),score=42.73 TRINITY_DN10094_c0_g1_i1:305-979(+)